MPSPTTDMKHSLPEPYRDKTTENTQILAELYNQLNQMSTPAFEKRFGDTLTDIHTYSEKHADADMLFFVLGAEIATEDTIDDGELIGHAETKFIFELGDDLFIDRYKYMANTIEDTDYFFLITIRPQDCPPGTGNNASSITLENYHDMLSAVTFRRFQLFQDNMQHYKKTILKPLVTALEDHHTKHADQPSPEK